MKARLLVSIALAAVISGCASNRPSMSYVAPEITATDAALLATDTVKFLTGPLPPAHTTLQLDAPAASSKPDVLTPVLLEKLRARGYGVVEADSKTGPVRGQGVMIRFLASPLDHGVVLRLQYPQREASRYYPRGADGQLAAGTEFTVRHHNTQIEVKE